MNAKKQFLALNKDAKQKLYADKPQIPKNPKYIQVEKSKEIYVRATRQLKVLKRKTLDPNDVALVTRIAAELLECDADLVRPLAQDFLQTFLDARTLDLLAWQIAGNRKVIKTRSICLYNNRQVEQSWMAGIILDVVKCPSADEIYAKVKLLDGPGAGFLVYAPLPSVGLRSLSHVLGMVRKGSDKRTRVLPDIRACVGAQVIIYSSGNYDAYSIEHLNNKKRILKSSNIGLGMWLRTTQKQKAYNKSLLEERSKPCINGLNAVCHECEVGYDRCLRSCKPNTTKSSSQLLQLTIKGKNLWPQKSLEEV